MRRGGMGRGTVGKWRSIIRPVRAHAAQQAPAPGRLHDMADELEPVPAMPNEPRMPIEPVAEVPEPDESRPVAEPRARSPWLVLAFVALLVALVWLGPAGGAAAAYDLFVFDPYACGGP